MLNSHNLYQYLIIFIFIFLATIFQSQAQAPTQFNYQAVLRDGNGQVMANEYQTIQVDILKDSPTGQSIFTEIHEVTTSAHGAINLIVGSGVSLSGIPWHTGDYYLQIRVDDKILGTSPLLSVPYALHANTAERLTGTLAENDPVFSASVSAGITATDTAYWNNKPDSLSESDPWYSSSVAAGITGVDTTYWNKKLDVEADSSVTNEIQYLSVSGDTIHLSGGNSVRLPPAFAGTNTDEQQLGISNDTIFLSHGGAVKLPRAEHYPGELYGGGIVFWVDHTGRHGLIASLDDLNGEEGAAWSNMTTTTIGEAAKDYFDGSGNTTAIINQEGHINSAAKLCADYTGGGYTDWYLPSLFELKQMNNALLTIYQVLTNDNDDTTNPVAWKYVDPTYGYYWSSDEYSYNTAWYFNFYNGYSNGLNKSSTYRVRAVRAF
jgi:hypothetical protein